MLCGGHRKELFTSKWCSVCACMCARVCLCVYVYVFSIGFFVCFLIIIFNGITEPANR